MAKFLFDPACAQGEKILPAAVIQPRSYSLEMCRNCARRGARRDKCNRQGSGRSRYPRCQTPMACERQLSAANIPGVATRDSARRLGLVTLPQIVAALVDAVEHPPAVERIMEVPEIRKRLGVGRTG